MAKVFLSYAREDAPAAKRNGVPLLKRNPGAPAVTPQLVAQLRDELA